MGVGVFGKLPARRDYVQHGVDPRLMALIDPWLQGSVAESRRALGAGWLDAWLCAPIWRFWLGRRIAGVGALGIVMPSVDGVGRYFPLCLLAAADDVAPPDQDAQAPWFDAAEALALDALAEGGSYEALRAGLGSLPRPVPARPEGGTPGGGADARDPVAAREPAMVAEIGERDSCWWMAAPGDGGPVRVLVRRGLPDPADYAGMIAPDPQPTPSAAPTTGGG